MELRTYPSYHFFFTNTPPPEIYTLSLHDALPIYGPCYLKLRGFSWELGISYFAPKRDSSSRLGIVLPDLPKNTSRSEEHTSELQSQSNLVCRLLLEKKKSKSLI